MKFSSLNRIYTILALNRTNSLTFAGDVAHYLKNVLRLKIGAKVRIFNSSDGEYLAEVTNITKHDIEVLITEHLRKVNQDQSLILGLSIIKNDRFTEAIKMAVQLGVTKIVPIVSVRSTNYNLNYPRLQKCIIEAIEQSERFCPPTLSEAINLKDFYESNNCEIIIYASEAEQKINSIKNLALSASSDIALLVGPEGGFAAEELHLMSAWSNSRSISLGNYVLRSEVAVAAALAQINLLRE